MYRLCGAIVGCHGHQSLPTLGGGVQGTLAPQPTYPRRGGGQGTLAPQPTHPRGGGDRGQLQVGRVPWQKTVILLGWQNEVVLGAKVPTLITLPKTIGGWLTEKWSRGLSV
jgi:hypothetical protein